MQDKKEEETALQHVGKGSVINKEKYDICEMMFSMEKRACDVAQEKLQNPDQNATLEEKGKSRSERKSNEAEMQGRRRTDHRNTEAKSSAVDRNCPSPDTSKTGHAPWQEGVLERLGQDLTPREYNMYMVHHCRMLLSFGQIEACTPRDKDFVYGSLEPIPVQTLHSFKVIPLK